MEIAHDPRPEYRQARFTDLNDIAAIEAEVFAEPYLYLMLRQLFELHGTAWLVAEIDGAVIGYALVLEKDGKALLFTFAVARRWQGRDYGRALLEAALARCRDLGAREMSLTVRPDNLRAGNLFKRVGFVFRTHDDRYFGPGEPRDVYAYPLGS
ncbi:GNAT family N-acetyltransferase [Nocardia spumae]|uniref:GNAT family N-acetyltransferase n=1 Tax=Nocardia spumae TaxID=2887190 RepID=UPI001D13EFF4|nr:GNAT family N-acetyltransferase [Nocardia spumae]